MSPPGKTKAHPLTPPLDRVDNQDLVSSNPASPGQPSNMTYENTQLHPYQTTFTAQDSHQLLPHPYEQEPSSSVTFLREEDDPTTIQPQIRVTYVGNLPQNSLKLLFSNASDRTSMAFQDIMRLRTLHTFILLRTSLSVTTSTSLLSRN